MGQARVDFGGSDRVTELIDRLNKKLEKTEKNVAEITKASKASETAGRQLWEKTRTPLEKYERQLARANELLQKGKIDQETYGRAVGKAREELERQNAASKKTGDAESIAKFAKLAGAWELIKITIAEATKALREFNDERERGADKLGEAAFDVGSLGQLPGGVSKNLGRAKALVASGAFGNLGEAAQFLFSAESGGFGADAPFLAKIRASLLERDVAGLGTSAKGFQAALGVGETGSIQDIVAKVIRTGESGSGSISQLLRAATIAAPGAGDLNISDEDVLAGVAALSHPLGAERAGTRLASLFTAAKREGIRFDGGLSGLVGAIQGRGGSALDLLGSQEAFQAYSLLASGGGDLAGTSRAIGLAPSQNVAQQRIAENLEAMGGTIRRRAATGRVTMRELDAGAEQELFETEREVMGDQLKRRGKVGRLQAQFMETLLNWQHWAGTITGQELSDINKAAGANANTDVISLLKSIDAGVRQQNIPIPSIER